MRLLQYKCPKCGEKSEELVSDSSRPICKKCGAFLERDYSGKIYGSTGKSRGGCSGDCSHCSGCSH